MVSNVGHRVRVIADNAAVGQRMVQHDVLLMSQVTGRGGVSGVHGYRAGQGYAPGQRGLAAGTAALRGRGPWPVVHGGRDGHRVRSVSCARATVVDFVPVVAQR